MNNSLARQAFTVLTGRGLIRLTLLLSFLIIARFLTPAEFGWFGIVTTGISLAATLGTLGLRQSFAYEIGQQRISARTAGLTGIILWPALAALSSTLVLTFLWPTFPNDNRFQLVFVVSVGVCGALLLSLFQGIPLGQGNIRQFTSSETAPRIILLFGAVALALLGALNVLSILWIYAVGFVITGLLLATITLRAGDFGRPIFRDLPKLISYGLVFSLNLFLVTLSTRISMFVIESSLGAAEAGLFFAASRVSEVFLELATAVGLVLFSSATRSGGGQSMLNRAADIVGWMVWLFLILCIIIFFTAPVLVRILLGSDYLSSTPVLQVLALGLVGSAGHKMIYPALAGTGRPYFGTPMLAVTVVLIWGLSVYLVPQYGVVGGAWAVVIGQWALFFSYIILCKIKFNIPIRKFILPPLRDVFRILIILKTKLIPQKRKKK